MDTRYCNFEEHALDWDSIFNLYWDSAQKAHSNEELIPIFDSIIQSVADYHLSIHTPNISIYKPLPVTYDYPLIYATNITGRNFFADSLILYSPNILAGQLQKSADGDIQAENQNYGYIHIHSFANTDDITCYKSTLQAIQTKSVKGIIVDLRGNNGGQLVCVEAFVSNFYSGKRILYQTCSRESKDNRTKMTPFQDYSQSGENTIPDDLPIIIIINAEVYSAANICAYILATFPNSMIIGSSSSSGGGTSSIEQFLPNGWVMSCPMDMKCYVNGLSCELPLEPDYLIEANNLISGNIQWNSCVETAIELIDSLNE
ncbi:MAG: S41 family peptidase [Paludibacteraceae bacterium]|nr:S41 family peptidase [Paludibacteraceae bacterium]